MTETQAKAEVFWLAFQALTRAQQREVLERLVRVEEIRRDLADLALIEERRDEPERPLRGSLAEIRGPEGRSDTYEESGWTAYDRLVGIWEGEAEGSCVAEDHDQPLLR